MFEKIEKLKQGKIDPNELLKSLSMDTTTKVQVASHPANKPEKVKVESQQRTMKSSSNQNKSAVNVVNNTQVLAEKNDKKVPKKSEAELREQLKTIIDRQNS